MEKELVIPKVDWCTGREVEVEKELRAYIDLIRANPRARTPDAKRKYRWEADSFDRKHGPVVSCEGLELSRVATKTAKKRLIQDFSRPVRENMAKYKVSETRKERIIQAEDKKVPIGPVSHQVNDDTLKVISLERDAKLSVRQQLALQLANPPKPQLSAEERDLVRRDGELEVVVRAEFLKNKIQQIRNRKETSPRRLRSQEKTSDDDQAAAAEEDDDNDDDQAAAAEENEEDNDDDKSKKSMLQLEEKARNEALQKFDKLVSKQELRARKRECSKLSQIKDLTEQPRRWVERGLIDALLSGNPKATRRRLLTLAMFPSEAPETIRATVKLALSWRQRTIKTPDDAPTWLSDCVAEIDSGITSEPIFISVVRLLLEARKRDHLSHQKIPTCPNLTTHLENESDSIGTSMAFAQCILLLNTYGVSAELVDAAEWSPLHHAARFGDAGVVHLLVTCLGADINRRTPDGSTALHIGICSKHAVAVSCTLVELGINVNLQNRQQQNALHLAAARGIIDIVEVLLIAGSDPYLIDSNGSTPTQVAYAAGHRVCVDIIRSNHSPVTHDMKVLSAAKRIELMTITQNASQVIHPKELLNHFANIRFTDLRHRAPSVLSQLSPSGTKKRLTNLRARRRANFAITPLPPLVPRLVTAAA